MILYHCMSARSFRALWMLEELGLPCDLRMLPFPPRVLKREYLETNPLGTIPLLIDGDSRLTESAAICQYLAVRHSPRALNVEPDEAGFADYLNFLHFGEATLTFPQTLLLRYGQFEPPERRHPQVVDDYGKWFLARLRTLEPRLRGLALPGGGPFHRRRRLGGLCIDAGRGAEAVAALHAGDRRLLAAAVAASRVPERAAGAGARGAGAGRAYRLVGRLNRSLRDAAAEPAPTFAAVAGQRQAGQRGRGGAPDPRWRYRRHLGLRRHRLRRGDRHRAGAALPGRGRAARADAGVCRRAGRRPPQGAEPPGARRPGRPCHRRALGTGAGPGQAGGGQQDRGLQPAAGRHLLPVPRHRRRPPRAPQPRRPGHLRRPTPRRRANEFAHHRAAGRIAAGRRRGLPAVQDLPDPGGHHPRHHGRCRRQPDDGARGADAGKPVHRHRGAQQRRHRHRAGRAHRRTRLAAAAPGEGARRAGRLRGAGRPRAPLADLPHPLPPRLLGRDARAGRPTAADAAGRAQGHRAPRGDGAACQQRGQPGHRHARGHCQRWPARSASST